MAPWWIWDLLARHWPRAVARAILIWVPLAVAATGLALLVDVAAQQVIRTSADEPQVQLAEDAAAHLDAGATPVGVVPPGTVDLARSLAPYVLVFDDRGALLAGSATLHGQAPSFPSGVLASARARGENRVTWQPEAGVRSATVTVPWRGGYVVAGRSLREAEARVDRLQLLIAAFWLALVAGTGGVALVASFAFSLLFDTGRGSNARGAISTGNSGVVESPLIARRPHL